jgi:hypothetical protein
VSNSILLISSLPDDRTFASEAATTAGLTLLTADGPKEGALMISKEEPVTILVDASTEAQYMDFENAIQETIGIFSEKINPNAIHFLSSAPLEDVFYLIRSPLFGHFVFRNYGIPAAAGQHYGRIIHATLAERAFGLKELLKPEAKIQVVKLKNTAQKQRAVEAVRNYLMSAKFQTRMATAVANAVDELLMNAMFDAPVDDLGRPTLTSTPRSSVFELTGKQEVELHVGYDGTYVGLMAVDQYGSLDKSKLLSHMSKLYTDSEYRIKNAVASAGLGLAMAFRSGGSFFFVSENKTRTEVTVFFRRTDNFREFRDQFRFISSQFYF